MKKKLLFVAVILVTLIVAAAVWLWYVMGQPLYEPGMAREETNLRAPLAPPSQGDEKDVWHVENDVRLHHFAEGTGSPVLVVHGGPGQPIGAPLAALAPITGERTFHYYDQRGCGKSTRPVERFESRNFMANVKELDRALGLAAQIADIERIRRILGEEKLVLLGHSFGGFLAALYAAEFPTHVERMVLIAPADLLEFPVEDGGLFGVIGHNLADDRKIPYDDFLDDYNSYGSLFKKDEAQLQVLNAQFGEWYFEAVGRDNVPAAVIGDPGAGGGWSVQGTYMSMGLRHDYSAALAAADAPVLILHGTADLSPLRGSQSFVDALPNARLELVEGAGHFFLFEENAAVARTIGDFLGVTSDG